MRPPTRPLTPTDRAHYPLSVTSCRPGKSVVINFVRDEDVKTLREIEDAYNVRIEETPMNVFELWQNNMEGESEYGRTIWKVTQHLLRLSDEMASGK